MSRLPPYVAAKGATLVFRRRIPAAIHRPETRHRLSALRTRCPREVGRRAAALMQALRLAGDGDAPAAVEREALGTLLDVKLAELAYEDSMTLDQATRDIRGRLFAEQPVAAISAPVMLSAAIAAAHGAAVSIDMARKIEGTGGCMLAFRGDMPLELFLERKNLLVFPLWLRRLPKPHGKDHGRNKYSKVGVEPDKHAVTAEADANDRKIIEEVGGRTDIDLRGERAELAKRLTRRLTDATVEHHHARIASISRTAKSDLNWNGPDFVSALPEFRRRAAAADNRTRDPLALRVTDSKNRTIWSLERGVAVAHLAGPLAFELGEHQSPILAGRNAPTRLGGLVLRGLRRASQQLCDPRLEGGRQRRPRDASRPIGSGGPPQRRHRQNAGDRRVPVGDRDERGQPFHGLAERPALPGVQVAIDAVDFRLVERRRTAGGAGAEQRQRP